MQKKHYLLVLLRVALGWLFFYAGITKVLNPTWSAGKFLQGADTFPSMYAWFANPALLPTVNFLNEWGLTLIGAGLILGLFTKWASWGGALLMFLYYFPGLDFPYVDHGFLVDDHIIYILAFLVLAQMNAGHFFGLDALLSRRAKSVS